MMMLRVRRAACNGVTIANARPARNKQAVIIPRGFFIKGKWSFQMLRSIHFFDLQKRSQRVAQLIGIIPQYDSLWFSIAGIDPLGRVLECRVSAGHLADGLADSGGIPAIFRIGFLD